MNGILQMLMQQLMSGQLQNNPAMQAFNQMMTGKNDSQKVQTILNLAKSKGIDVNQKIFSSSDLKNIGLNM